MTSMRSRPLIHPSAWKGDSQKLVCSILHTPGPTGSENS
jgi:hypothetical protein